jgi:hypothetical protein
MAKSPLSNYRTRFEKMVERLRAHPDIALLNFHMAEPVSAATLASVKKKLTVPLDPAIAAFYRQCDGLSLRWISKRHPDYEPKRMKFSSRRLSWRDVVKTDGEEDGCVCILPLEQALVKMDWKGRINFDTDTDEDPVEFGRQSYGSATFNRAVRPFDWFNFYNMMGFLLLPGSASLPVVMGSDHGVCWTDSRTTDFASYLETVLAHYGSVMARRRLYNKVFGHRQKPLLHSRAQWQEQPPSLEKILKQAEKEWP